ncbi:MAG TPA: tetratricopeptide repeat protein [Vicinamibacterales bacterium]
MRAPSIAGAALTIAIVLLVAAPVHAGQERPSAAASTAARVATLLDANDLAAAQAAVDAALRERPRDPLIQNLAGVVAARHGRAPDAEARFREAIRLEPRYEAAYENLGRLLQEQSATVPDAADRALKVYRALLRVAPSNAEGLFQAATLLARRGEFAEARALVARLPAKVRGLARVLALDAVATAGARPAEAPPIVARLAASSDLVEADLMSLSPAFDRLPDPDQAIALLEVLDERGLASRDTLHRLGALQLKAERYADARDALERAAAGAPTVPILMDLARAAHKQGEGKAALGYLAHARDLEPDNAGVHFFFGLVCVELDLGAEAYESLKRAVALDPDNPYVNYAMGAVSIHRHEPSEALPYFDAYIRLKPEDPRGRFARGAARFYSNQLEAARPDLEEASRHPETAAGAHYFLGRIARQLHDLPGARRELDRALTLQPQLAEAWAELGLVQMRQDDVDAAQRSLDRALAIDPDNYEATMNLATLYARTRDPRREEQAARLAALQQARAARAQEFLRIVQVVP